MTETPYILFLTIGDEFLPATLSYWLLVFWVLTIGGLVGSFLNVVAYRIPLGMSLVFPGSHCPMCEGRIRAYDNLPVIGWILLARKCRDCRTPIPFRYPLVEAIVAAVFLIVAIYGPLDGGDNLPLTYDSYPYSPVSATLLWLGYFNWMLLLSTLICAALFEVDGDRIPFRVFVPVLLCGLALAGYWSEERSLPLSGLREHEGWPLGLLRSFYAMLAGAGFGIAGMLGSMRGIRAKGGWWAIPIALAACGAVLSWQAVAVLASVSFAAFLILKFIGAAIRPLERIPFFAVLTICATLYICIWRPLTTQFPQLGEDANRQLCITALPVVFVLSALVWCISPRRRNIVDETTAAEMT